MKRASIFVVSLWIFAVNANAQKMLSGKVIYRVNRDAVVQIYAGNEFGNGFIVSSNGIIVTANHVVTTRESHFRQYVSDIKVVVFRDGTATAYPAIPVETQISDDQINFDFARLKITASDLPHVALGSSKEIDIGGQVTIIPSFPGPGDPYVARHCVEQGRIQERPWTKACRYNPFSVPDSQWILR
jgi:S1-C subfamily serine protease